MELKSIWLVGMNSQLRISSVILRKRASRREAWRLHAPSEGGLRAPAPPEGGVRAPAPDSSDRVWRQ